RARIGDRPLRPLVGGVPQSEPHVEVDPRALPQGETGGVEVDRRRIARGGVPVLPSEARGLKPAGAGADGKGPNRHEKGETLHVVDSSSASLTGSGAGKQTSLKHGNRPSDVFAGGRVFGRSAPRVEAP